jgi:rare lipoprotein A
MDAIRNILFCSLTLIPAISFSSPLIVASVYSGERTANGEYARASALTAAHRTLPFGTRVEVTNVETGRSVVVRINDRGRYIRGRVIDLTPAGARAIGSSGLAPVRLTVLSDGARRASRSDRSTGG